MRKLTSLIALVLSCGVLLLASTGIASADKKPLPKPQPKEHLVITIEDVIITSTHVDGSTERFDLDGRLHLASQVILNSQGEATEFRLHANLMNASGTSLVSEESVQANGSIELSFIPTEPCTPAECVVPVWQLSFPDVVKQPPPGPPFVPVPYPNLVFTLQVSTSFDSAGALTSASLVTDIID